MTPGAWEIVSIVKQYPEDQLVLDNQVFAGKVLRAPFAENSMPQRGQRYRAITDEKEPAFVHFDNSQSMLVIQEEDFEAQDQQQ